MALSATATAPRTAPTPATRAAQRPFDALQAPAPAVADPELVDQVKMAFENDPPVPTASQAASLQVITLLAQPQFPMQRLTQLVQQDPALSAGVLRSANTAAHRGGEVVETVRDALVRLGAQETGRVAGIVAARTLFQPNLQAHLAWVKPQLEACYFDAVVTAKVAAEKSLDVRGTNTDRVFLGAVLHDIGRPVALRCLVALTQGRGSLPAAQIEAVVDAVHVELGGLTHDRLELPRSAAMIAKNHHELELPEGPTFTELHVVRLVSALVRWRRCPSSIVQGRAEIDSSAHALGLDGHALRALDTRVKEVIIETAK
ncbi:MAG: HDOD domain-containing protein [Myxococcaceae bacterium]|nr:HDOD domain-containing protein [Myxococcaceae bacterium]